MSYSARLVCLDILDTIIFRSQVKGSSFVYNFQADLYGTSWYHSHYSGQYAGGLLGPMIIHGPSNAPYDLDLGPVFLTGQ